MSSVSTTTTSWFELAKESEPDFSDSLRDMVKKHASKEPILISKFGKIFYDSTKFDKADLLKEQKKYKSKKDFWIALSTEFTVNGELGSMTIQNGATSTKDPFQPSGKPSGKPSNKPSVKPSGKSSGESSGKSSDEYCPVFNTNKGCQKKNCSKKHPTAPCRHHLNGGCDLGAMCTFSHKAKTSTNDCNHGARCMKFGCYFTHPPGRKEVCKFGKKSACPYKVCSRLHNLR